MSREAGGKTVGLAGVCPADARRVLGVAPPAGRCCSFGRSPLDLPPRNASSEINIAIFVPPRAVHLLQCRARAPLARRRPLVRRLRTPWSYTNMIQINDISDLFDFPLYYQEGEPAFHSNEASPPPSSPPTHPPDSPESSTSTLSDSTNPRSPALTEEEETHYDNVIFHGVDSPGPLQPPTLIAETSITLAYSPPPFALSPTITDTPSPSAISTNSSPRTSSASISPPALKRPRSLTVESTEPEPGPSTSSPPISSSRPAKRPRISVPGESAFQLDVQVPAFTSSTPSGPPMGRTRQRVDYSACKCRNRTSKPARHWKTACPYNINRSTNRVTCELCDMTFSRHDNMDRHMADYH